MKIFLLSFFIFIYSFISNAQLSIYCYNGNIHSHTDYSGGVGVPLNAFNYANNSSDLDFLAVTDHLESIYYSSYEWDSIKISANLVSVNNQFIGMAGYEWTSPTYNHVNIFNTSGMVSPLNVNNWDAFLADLLTQPNAIAQFNHPGLIGSNNWNNFAYKTAAFDSIFRLIEVKKFSDDVYYQMALNNGWHVSPTNNQDNHQWNWGTLDDKRTGIWAGSLSYYSIIDALQKRRTFSTEDKNASIRMEYNGHFMGSFASTGTNSAIRIMLSDGDGEFWNEVNVVGSNNNTIYSSSFSQSLVDTVLHLNTLGLTWIFIRAKQMDGDYVWSAPVFLSPASSIEALSSMKKELKIFPNPVHDFFYLSIENGNFKESKIQIYDVTGKLLHSMNVDNLNTGFKINVSFLPQGYYLLTLTSPDKQYSSGFSIVK